MVTMMLVRKSSFFDDTMAKHSGLKDKLRDFLKVKSEDPTQPFAKDTPFISSGPIGRTGLKLRHAHLTQDVSVVYRIHGKDPHTIDLYGVYRHKDLGTNTSSKVNTQKQLAKKFKNEDL